jgi:uncharacterized protein (UPF0333 family)
MEMILSFLAGLVLAGIGAFFMLRSHRSSAEATLQKALADAAIQAKADKATATARLQSDLENAQENLAIAKKEAIVNTQTTSNRAAPRELSREEIEKQFRYAEQVAAIHKQNGRVGESAPRCFVQTFGCQQNEADSERIAGLAILMGYTITHDPTEAKLILVNTCAVREHAEKKALSIIGQYKHLKDADPEVIIGVGGCMVTQQHRADQLIADGRYVWATVTELQEIRTINGLRGHPCVILAHYTDSQGQTHNYKSRCLYKKPVASIIGKPIKVYIEGGNHATYYMDPEPLLKQTMK